MSGMQSKVTTLKNGINLNSLTTATATATATTTATVAASIPLAPPAAPPPNIELKPPASKPLKPSFSTPLNSSNSIGIVHATKRGRQTTIATATATNKTSSAASVAKLDINALRSQLYQGATKTVTQTTTTTARGERGRGAANVQQGGTKKKRCLDRYDSSESSDR
ncbi:GH20940 [Drosophila grimshawi]|uniref:GH20940 n=1 Tax=Drosophila grimshawi TaxID=7222 RepID=B4J483_DROGR|nr:GH20940 [Drosophila grimshawi]